MHPNDALPEDPTENDELMPNENIIFDGIKEKIKERYDVKNLRMYNDKEMGDFLFPNTITELGASYASIVEGFYTNQLGKAKDKKAPTLLLCKSWVVRHVKMVSL